MSALARSCKMENIEIFEMESFGGTVTYVKIDRGNGEYTTMLKSTWDELEAQKELGATLS